MSLFEKKWNIEEMLWVTEWWKKAWSRFQNSSQGLYQIKIERKVIEVLETLPVLWQYDIYDIIVFSPSPHSEEMKTP